MLQDRKHLDMLPNFAYSMPLALFIRGTANSSGEDLQASRHLLSEALMRFPGLFRALMEKVQHLRLKLPTDIDFISKRFFFGRFFQLDIPQAHIHTPAAFSRLFSLEENDGLALLQALYVRRCVDFWKDASVVAYLMETASEVIARASGEKEREKMAAFAERYILTDSFLR